MSIQSGEMGAQQGEIEELSRHYVVKKALYALTYFEDDMRQIYWQEYRKVLKNYLSSDLGVKNLQLHSIIFSNNKLIFYYWHAMTCLEKGNCRLVKHFPLGNFETDVPCTDCGRIGEWEYFVMRRHNGSEVVVEDRYNALVGYTYTHISCFSMTELCLCTRCVDLKKHKPLQYNQWNDTYMVLHCDECDQSGEQLPPSPPERELIKWTPR